MKQKTVSHETVLKDISKVQDSLGEVIEKLTNHTKYRHKVGDTYVTNLVKVANNLASVYADIERQKENMENQK